MSINLIVTPKEIDFCGNGLAFRVQGTQYLPEMDDFKILAEIHLVAGDGSTMLINELEFDVNDNGMVEFKVGRIIKDYIESSLPVLGSTAWFVQPLQKYTVAIREFSEHPSFSTLAPELFTAYAVNGKLSFADFPGFDFIQDTEMNKPFLNAPGEIETWPGKHSFLYFYNPHPSTEVAQVRFTLYYTDLTKHEVFVNILNFHPEVKSFYGFPCSMDVWDLNQYNTDKEIYKYEVEMWHFDNSQLCQKKTFRVIEKPMFVREFCFRNKFGLPEFFHCSGKSTTRLITKKTISKKELPIDYTATDMQYTERLESSHNEVEASSGNIHVSQALALQDALFSEAFFEIENGAYIPCIISDGTFEIIPESGDIVSFKFTYRKAFDI